MIDISFPDSSTRGYPKGVTPLEIANSISSRLAKEVLAASVDGKIKGLMEPIEVSSSIQLHKWEDEEAKHTFWHSSAHLLAAAIESLYPHTQFGVGPAIENGFYYDMVLPNGKTLSEKDLLSIEKKMKEIAQTKEPYLCSTVTKKDATQLFGEKNSPYKVELIEGIEDKEVTLYKTGDFVDLCRGPHLPDTSLIKAIKLTAISGAYWKGDQANDTMIRIYGVSFPKQKMLDDHLAMLEEAKKRDHRKLGEQLQLFTFSSAVGSGLPMWLPNGAILREQLENYLKKVQRQHNYLPVITPHIGDINLYKTSGHYQKYGEDSFQSIKTGREGEEFLLKPMNCPHHCEIYKSSPRSYKDLPLRLSEFGTVYRYEKSGELQGLTRVRGFTQDDAHIFCTPEQLKEEFCKVIDIILTIFKALAFTNYSVQVSLRDPKDNTKYIGSDENWNRAERAIIEATEEKGLKTTVEYGEAAFYGPKLDFMVRDAIGRKWQLGTIQVDYNLPERFDLTYTGSDDQKHRPIMIHRAPFGSLERFCALLIEHTAGKFPIWLAPKQVIVLPISDKFNKYAKKIVSLLNNSDIRSVLDERVEKIGRKIRDAETAKIPYLLVVGAKEEETNTVSVRRQGEGDQGQQSIDDFLTFLHGEIDKYVK